MKIFEITEADIGTVTVKKGPLKGFIFDPLKDGRIKVTAPDGTSMTATSQANAEKLAQKHIRTTTPDTPAKKTDAPTKNEPKVPAYNALGVKTFPIDTDPPMSYVVVENPAGFI